MATILQFDKNKVSTPPIEKRVCANCNFYRRRMGVGECDAFGGKYAESAWRECQGTYWMKKRGVWTRLKEFFS